MKCFNESRRLRSGITPRRSALAAWIAGFWLAASLTTAPVITPPLSTAYAQPQPAAPAINWVEQTWILVPAGPGTWVLMLSMAYDKGGSVLLPVGTIVGVDEKLDVTPHPSGSDHFGFRNTSTVQSSLEGTLLVDDSLVKALGLESIYGGGISSLRWNYTHPTEGDAYLQLASVVRGAEWYPLLKKIQRHYETTVTPGTLPEWDPATTLLEGKHDQPSRVKVIRVGGSRVRWTTSDTPMLLDTIRPTATGAVEVLSTKEAAARRRTLAQCEAAVNLAADQHIARAKELNAPFADRAWCIACIELERDTQLFNCARGLPTSTEGMLVCLKSATPASKPKKAK